MNIISFTANEIASACRLLANDEKEFLLSHKKENGNVEISFEQIAEAIGEQSLSYQGANFVLTCAGYSANQETALCAELHLILLSAFNIFGVGGADADKAHARLWQDMPQYADINGDTIRYYRNFADRKRDKTVTCKTRRYIARILEAAQNGLSKQTQLSDFIFNSRDIHDAPKIHFLSNDCPGEWQLVYESDFWATSCMTAHAEAPAGFACAHLLPENLKEKQTVALVATYDDDGDVLARCIVNTAAKKGYAIYGQERAKQVLRTRLIADGYKFGCPDWADGLYIASEEGWNNEHYRAPYLDGHSRADFIWLDGKPFWHVTQNGAHSLTNHECAEICVVEYVAYCERCGEGITEDEEQIEVFTVDIYDDLESDGIHCEHCAQYIATYVDAVECYVRDERIIKLNGNLYPHSHSWMADNLGLYWDEYEADWLPIDNGEVDEVDEVA